MNFVTPEVEAKNEVLFNKLTSAPYWPNYKVSSSSTNELHDIRCLCCQLIKYIPIFSGFRGVLHRRLLSLGSDGEAGRGQQGHREVPFD
jgi:hypothetical protein